MSLCVSVSVCVCVCTPRRGAVGLLPTEQQREGDQKQSCRIFSLPCCTPFFFIFPPLSLSFPLFLPPFHCFYFSHPRGRAGHPRRGGTGSPGGSTPPSPGCEARGWVGGHGGGSATRAPPAPERRLPAALPGGGEGFSTAERVYLGSAPRRSLTFRSHRPRGVPAAPPGGNGTPAKGRPLAPLFPVCVRACLP